MSERNFQFRLRSSHPAPDRATQDLVVEFLGDSGAWEPQLLLFQHFYLVANAREKAIPLQQVEADFIVTTSSDWIVTSVNGDFRNLPDGVRKRIELTSLGLAMSESFDLTHL